MNRVQRYNLFSERVFENLIKMSFLTQNGVFFYKKGSFI